MGIISVGVVPLVVGDNRLAKGGEEARLAPPDPPANPPLTEPAKDPPSLLPTGLDSVEDCLA